MSSIITVENLGKKYTIGHQRQGDYQTFRDSISHGVKSIYQRLRHPFSPNLEEIDTEEFWALKDINFEVKQGDRIGIIGRNGAGKSTLLKILSRITHPTTGKIHIKGRVASLLEVGTGFHPELTGRENIFLNGAILGMTKNDIRMRFDEIVRFSEVEKFLDTPVKRYSSGMYVRLAFAVAAHLEPEILIVDEVLAVGDTVFQKKCLGKMKDVSKEGRTVIFVSHNMGAIMSLCQHVKYLRKGRLYMDGAPEKVISEYFSLYSKSGFINTESTHSNRTGEGPMRITAVGTYNPQNQIQSEFTSDTPVTIKCNISGVIGSSCILALAIRTARGEIILHMVNTDANTSVIINNDHQEVSVTIPSNTLNDGCYYITAWLGDKLNLLHDRLQDCLEFNIKNFSKEKIRSIAPIICSGHWNIK